MQVSVLEEKEVVFLRAECQVRYWEDASINGKEDTEGKIPGRKGDLWEILIDLESGKIIDWPNGVTADINYKVCDCGKYSLLDSEKISVVEIEGYVPHIMSPKEEGYGDYVIMEIEGDGRISGFDGEDLEEFNTKEN